MKTNRTKLRRLLLMAILSSCSPYHHAFRIGRSRIRPRTLGTKAFVLATSQQQENATVNSSGTPQQVSTDNWRSLPSLNPTLHFGSWIVPTQSISIQELLDNDLLQPYLGTRVEQLQYMRRRLKLVYGWDHSLLQEHSPVPDTKVILTHPETPSLDQLPQPILDYLRPDETNIADGPSVSIDFSYRDFQVNHILEQLLPKEAHPVPSAYEQVGHVAHLNLNAIHLPYRYLIGQALLEHPHVETVIQKVGEVSGPYRTYHYEVLAGRNDTHVQVVENRLRLRFDLSKVYWCSRLHEERRRLLKVMLQDGGNVLADPFCGVGSLCLHAAQAGMQVVANDWNPDAIEALKENARLNQISSIRAECGDAYDFLVDLGMEAKQLPDHVVMNYPLESFKFLGALRWWPATTNEPRVHVYLFARDSETLSAEDVALNTIAHHLLPTMNAVDDYEKPRLHELNSMFGCRIRVHRVRDVAPGKMVFCVSLTATRKLLKHMQGDFV